MPCLSRRSAAAARSGSRISHYCDRDDRKLRASLARRGSNPFLPFRGPRRGPVSCRLTHLEFSTCSVQIAVLITYQACCHYAKKFLFLIEISDWLLVVGAPRPVIIWRTQRRRWRGTATTHTSTMLQRERQSAAALFASLPLSCVCMRCDDAADERRNGV